MDPPDRLLARGHLRDHDGVVGVDARGARPRRGVGQPRRLGHVSPCVRSGLLALGPRVDRARTPRGAGACGRNPPVVRDAHPALFARLRGAEQPRAHRPVNAPCLYNADLLGQGALPVLRIDGPGSPEAGDSFLPPHGTGRIPHRAGGGAHDRRNRQRLRWHDRMHGPGNAGALPRRGGFAGEASPLALALGWHPRQPGRRALPLQRHRDAG